KKIKTIFLSWIYQNAGKTTVALGLYQAMRERGINAAIMKPVGQIYVSVGDLKIDKDSYLFGEVFKFSCQWHDMSPVTIDRGYTEKYILNPNKDHLGKEILKSFNNLTSRRQAIIIEGTGHAGVGSVIDFSNADVARLLGSKVIIISEGGIGKTIDEIMLNKALFDAQGVEVIGVIINKVLPDKYDKVKNFLEKGLSRKGIRLLGVIPHQPLLSAPRMEQIAEKLGLDVLCGKINLRNRVKHVIVAAMEPHNMIHYLEDGTLVLASGDRVDNILLAVSSHLVRDSRSFKIAGMILTGGLKPNPAILELLSRSHIPVLISSDDTFTVATKVEQSICKIEKKDKDKIEESGRLVKKFVDVNTILNVV
ncbi:MAG: AAA family ATPase, partial [Candidatus Omnitrophica bacterium]|nr:AAA family ATPase [Candidatus Omnitrophota bacterium]